MRELTFGLGDHDLSVPALRPSTLKRPGNGSSGGVCAIALSTHAAPVTSSDSAAAPAADPGPVSEQMADAGPAARAADPFPPTSAADRPRSNLALAALVRNRRRELGLSLERASALSGLSTVELTTLETVGTGGYSALRDLADVFLIPLSALMDVAVERAPKPSSSLRRATAALAERGCLLPALQRAIEWAEIDETLTMYAVPGPYANVDSLMGRAAPAVAAPAFSPVALPVLSSLPPRAKDAYGPEFARSRHLALQLELHLALTGPVSHSELLAASGVARGCAPLDPRVRALVARPGDSAFIMTNSRLRGAVQDAAAAHLLVHLLLGDVLAISMDLVEDEDDDSIYSCSGIHWERCSLAAHVLNQLTNPSLMADWEARDADREAFEAWAAERFPDAEKLSYAEQAALESELSYGTRNYALPTHPILLEPGETLPHFQVEYARERLHREHASAIPDEELPIPTVTVEPLRRYLGVDNDDLVGASETGPEIWPAALVERYLGVISRGLFNLSHLDKLGIAGMDAPQRDRVALALARFEQVDYALHGVRADRHR